MSAQPMKRDSPKAASSHTPWTDSAINALGADAFKPHGTIWDELRRIESSHADLLAALSDLEYASLRGMGIADGGKVPDTMIGRAIASARAAIAKAEGRT